MFNLTNALEIFQDKESKKKYFLRCLQIAFMGKASHLAIMLMTFSIMYLFNKYTPLKVEFNTYFVCFFIAAFFISQFVIIVLDSLFYYKNKLNIINDKLFLKKNFSELFNDDFNKMALIMANNTPQINKKIFKNIKKHKGNFSFTEIEKYINSCINGDQKFNHDFISEI